MLSPITRTLPLVLLLVAAALYIWFTLSLPAFVTPSPRSQIAASLFLIIAVFVWLIFGTRGTSDEEDVQEPAE